MGNYTIFNAHNGSTVVPGLMFRIIFIEVPLKEVLTGAQRKIKEIRKVIRRKGARGQGRAREAWRWW